jgi:mannose-6-phosphate isomerase-like protein (cupin superfamily)
MLGRVGDIEQATLDNTTFRTVLFTGEHEQLTVMGLQPGEDIGREVHDDHDQFLRIEEGRARVEFGRSADEVDETHEVEDDWAIIVPAGVWHNVINVGDADVKLYSLYAARVASSRVITAGVAPVIEVSPPASASEIASEMTSKITKSKIVTWARDRLPSSANTTSRIR